MWTCWIILEIFSSSPSTNFPPPLSCYLGMLSPAWSSVHNFLSLKGFCNFGKFSRIFVYRCFGKSKHFSNKQNLTPKRTIFKDARKHRDVWITKIKLFPTFSFLRSLLESQIKYVVCLVFNFWLEFSEMRAMAFVKQKF